MIQRIACIGTDMHCNINRREIRNTVHGTTYYSLTRTDGINSTLCPVTDTETACYLFCFVFDDFLPFHSISFLDFLSLLYQLSVNRVPHSFFLFWLLFSGLRLEALLGIQKNYTDPGLFFFLLVGLVHGTGHFYYGFRGT